LHKKRASLQLQISQGSVATHFGYGGIFNDSFVKNVCQLKNFENRSIFS